MKIRAKAPDWFPYPGVEVGLEVSEGGTYAGVANIAAFGRDKEDAINRVWEHLHDCIQGFVECDESELSEGGLRYRNDLKKLLGM